ALDEFRRQQMIEKYGAPLLDALGPCVIMPDSVVDRLAECAEANKIASTDDIQREVGKKWSKGREYGETVVGIIHQHFPREAPFVSTPLASRARVNNTAVASPSPTNPSRAQASSSTQTPAVRPTVRQYKCSACHQSGHNSESY
ncbi:uncharacterized protein B0H18DRAFT_824391, partial [Fomitopsis serialis]|uniref:uncharacterized protein n=1 Tax=Fomitopsis serialis TaxID=139415 RepID=UPI0020074DF2